MKVDVGSFGYAEPTQGQRVRVPRPGNEHLHALGQLGDTITAIGLEEMRRQKADEDAAQRSAAGAELIGFRNDAYEFSREMDAGLREGRIKREEAPDIFTKQMKGLRDQRLERVAPAMRQALDQSLTEQELNQRVAFDRTLDDVRRGEIGANIVRAGEELDRLAVRDPVGASGQYRALLDNLGPSAGFSKQDIEIRSQAFAERGLTNHVVQRINEASNSRGTLVQLKDQLKDEKTFGGLDPAKRNDLLRTVSSMVDQLDNRARINQEAALRKLELEFNSYAVVAESGKPLSPGLVVEASKKFKGTPFEKPFSEVVSTAATVGAFSSQPVPVQYEALLQESARMNTEGATPRQLKSFQARQRAHAAVAKEYDADPLQAAIDYRVVDDIPRLTIDLSNPDSLRQQFAARMEYVNKVEAWGGKPAAPLFPDEAKAIKDFVRVLPPSQRAKTLGTLSGAMGTPERAGKFFAQLGKEDPELGIVGYLASKNAKTYQTGGWFSSPQPGRDVAAMAVEGFDLLRDKQVSLPESLGPAIRTKLHGVYTSPEGLQTATQATTALYAKLLQERGTYKQSTHDSNLVDQAIQFATGGIYDGRHGKLPKPYGWTDGQLDDRIGAITAEDLVRAGGTLEMPETQAVKFLSNAMLQSAGDGRYAVLYGSGLLRRKLDGAPLILDVGAR